MFKNCVAAISTLQPLSLIFEEKPTNPKYFEKMSVLLDELIREKRD
jgi:hypothetical protein